MRLQNIFFFIYSGYFIYVFDSVCFYMYLCTSIDNPLCIDLTCFLLSCGVNEFLGSDNLACYSPADDMSTSSAREGYLASGVNSILPKEHAGSFVNLPISKAEMDNGSVCSTIIYTLSRCFFSSFKVFTDMTLLSDFRLAFLCEFFLILIDLCCCILEFHCA